MADIGSYGYTRCEAKNAFYMSRRHFGFEISGSIIILLVVNTVMYIILIQNYFNTKAIFLVRATLAL